MLYIDKDTYLINKIREMKMKEEIKDNSVRRNVCVELAKEVKKNGIEIGKYNDDALNFHDFLEEKIKRKEIMVYGKGDDKSISLYELRKMISDIERERIPSVENILSFVKEGNVLSLKISLIVDALLPWTNSFKGNRGDEEQFPETNKSKIKKIYDNFICDVMGEVVLCPVKTNEGKKMYCGKNPILLPDDSCLTSVIAHHRIEVLRRLKNCDEKMSVRIIHEDKFMDVYHYDKQRAHNTPKEVFTMESYSIGKLMLSMREEMGLNKDSMNYHELGLVSGFAHLKMDKVETRPKFKKLPTVKNIVAKQEANSILESGVKGKKLEERMKDATDILEKCSITSIVGAIESKMNAEKILPNENCELSIKDRVEIINAYKRYHNIMEKYENSNMRKTRKISFETDAKKCPVWGTYRFLVIFLYDAICGGNRLKDFTIDEIVKKMNNLYKSLQPLTIKKSSNLYDEFKMFRGEALHCVYISSLMRG